MKQSFGHYITLFDFPFVVVNVKWSLKLTSGILCDLWMSLDVGNNRLEFGDNIYKRFRNRALLESPSPTINGMIYFKQKYGLQQKKKKPKKNQEKVTSLEIRSLTAEGLSGL